MIPEPPGTPRETSPDTQPEVAPDGASDPVADQPPLDSIDAESDLAPWLRAGVPAAIRNAALRRKWLATPAIRDYVDPALDYAWDWNAATAVPGATGRIATDAARKMLRALTDPPPPDTPPAESRDTDAGADEGAETLAAGRADTAAPGQEQPESPASAPDRPARPDPAPRAPRHGGALPRPRG